MSYITPGKAEGLGFLHQNPYEIGTPGGGFLNTGFLIIGQWCIIIIYNNHTDLHNYLFTRDLGHQGQNVQTVLRSFPCVV